MKNILITGSTDGIGKLAALKLAREGHHIFLHGRNAEKLAAVIAEVKADSKNERVQGFVADFSDLKAVKAMGKQVAAELGSLDVLINNAGILSSPQAQTKDGFDIRFEVNYLAPVVLTNALLPLLHTSKTPRIVNLGSAAQAPVSLQALSGKTQISTRESYAQSKLALTMWSFDLAKREPDIQVIVINPGSLLNTKMAREAYGQHWAPAEKGSNMLVDLAMLEEYAGITGKYFDNDKGSIKGAFAEAHPDAYNQEKIAQLISATQKAIGGVLMS